MEAYRLARTKSAIERFNWSAHADTQKQVAAARHILRAVGLQR
jgi:hypothetical protein